MDPRQLMPTPEDGPINEAEDDGIFLEAVIAVQCMGGVRDADGNMVQPCGKILKARVNQMPEGEVETSVVCPDCSQRAGIKVSIPVAILVGQEVADILDEPDDEPMLMGPDHEQPFDGQEALDGHGPMRVVTEDGEELG